MIEKLILPEQITRHIKNMQCEKDAGGCSANDVYKFYSPEKTLYLKTGCVPQELGKEYKIMSWLKGRLPVPEVIEWVCVGERDYLLMTEIGGEAAYDDYYLKNPLESVSLLAKGIKMLQSIEITNCPFRRDLDIKLKLAAEDIDNKDMSDWNKETERRFSSPQELLEYLIKNRPEKEDLAFTHGDYCLPNVFGIKSEVAGFIDLGNAGIADIWQDIALCIRSMRHNLSSYEYDDILLEQIGVPMNKEKLDYYILLDELF